MLEYAYKKVDISDKNNEAIQQILKEIEMIKKLDHPNIIKLYEANISKDNKYIELLAELPEDGDLQMKLDEYECDYMHFQENQLLDWLNQICLALKSLHSEKILHRNIKPSSISLMKHGYAKLSDFGFAKIATKGRDLKRVKTFMNKIKFTAPEIFEKNDFTEKTDIWFLGVTFFQLMTFKFPFKGENDDEKMESISNEYKNDYNYSYSDNFKELINKMISRKPIDRPSPDEILDMPFIRKRMECYVDENENQFLKAQETLDIFGQLEEIQTVDNNVGEEQKENKKEIRIIDNNNDVIFGQIEEIQTVGNYEEEEQKEENKEIRIDNNKNDILGDLEEIQTVRNNEEEHKEEKKGMRINHDNIFSDLEEIQTVNNNIGEEQKEEKKEKKEKKEKTIDNNNIFADLEEIQTVKEHEEEHKEKLIDINSNIEKIKEDKEDNNEDNKKENKDNNKDKDKSIINKKDKNKGKRVRFNLNEEEII